MTRKEILEEIRKVRDEIRRAEYGSACLPLLELKLILAYEVYVQLAEVEIEALKQVAQCSAS